MMKKLLQRSQGLRKYISVVPSNWGWGSEQEGWKERLGGTQRNDLFNKKWAIL